MSKNEIFIKKNHLEILVEISTSDNSIKITRIGSFDVLNNEVMELFKQFIMNTSINSIDNCIDKTCVLPSIWACGDARCILYSLNDDCIILMLFDINQIEEDEILFSKRIVNEFKFSL